MNDCPLCDTPLIPEEIGPTPIFTEDGSREVHRCCMLREVIGGIGHLIAHEYWCVERGDPDADLPRYVSAKLVWHLVQMMGVEEVVSRGEEARTN